LLAGRGERDDLPARHAVEVLVQRCRVERVQSGQIVGTAQGSAEDVSPSQTVTVQLVSSDPMIAGRFRYQFQVDTEF
jgi:hypothetical protein